MRNLFVLITLLILSTPAWCQSAVPETKINLAWVDGVYWNPDILPGWGFFVDAQEDTFFGAIYGYDGGSNSTFIVLQGTVTSLDPLVYQGDVFSVSNGGSTATDVGNFTWSVNYFEASPAASLTITSNILNANNLPLVRFSYVETDKVDMFTAADWNIIIRILGVTFGYHYGIYDDRIEEDGITFALVVHNEQPDEIGVIAYFPPGNGDMYALLIEFNEDTNLFAAFFASDTEMYGRSWLLDEDESPIGNGNYYRGYADTIQESHQTLDAATNSAQIEVDSQSSTSASAVTEMENLQLSLYSDSNMESQQMFSESKVQDVYQTMIGIYLSNKDHLK